MIKVMGKNNKRYHFHVVWSEDDREYVGLCHEIPSLSHLDKNSEKALEGIIDLTEFVVREFNL